MDQAGAAMEVGNDDEEKERAKNWVLARVQSAGTTENARPATCEVDVA
jgi:hypothetical protein